MTGGALVIGGTGPTGPGIVGHLLNRGFAVTIAHSGRHEVAFDGPVRHLHGPVREEPFLREVFDDAPEFDVVVATYGRIAALPRIVRDRVGRLITIGGATYIEGLPHPADESSERVRRNSYFQRILEAEDGLAAGHASGWYSWTHLRYPELYGPRQTVPRDWSIVRRLRDGRRHLLAYEGGSLIMSRAFTENAVHAVGLVIDQPDESAGRAFNVCDDALLSDAQRAAAIANVLGVDVELVSVPASVWSPHVHLGAGRKLRQRVPGEPAHQILSSTAIRRDLGLGDRVTAGEGLRRTVEWLLANPPVNAGPEEQAIGDRFDYAVEDELIDRARSYAQGVASLNDSAGEL